MNKRLRSLLAKRDSAQSAAAAIVDGLPGSAELTDAQCVQVDSHMAEVKRLDHQIYEEEQLAEQALTAPAIESPHISGGYSSSPASARGGFGDFGEFIHATLRAGNPHLKSVDDRLTIGAAPTTYGNEGVGEDGGYLVPTEFSNTIFSHGLESNSLLPFCRTIPIDGNAMDFPVSETTPWGSSGVRVFWDGEGEQLNQSKPTFESRELRLRKLTALLPVTNELLEDSSAMAAFLPIELGAAVRWAINDKIINGAGTGVPQGFVNSGALVTQAKEGSQAADTINAENVSKMYSRCINPETAIWLINPDSFPQLPLMTIGDAPVWVPQSAGLESTPGGSLLGRPIILTDACQTLGDAGDIYFADLKSYQIIQKKRSTLLATSMHLWFDYDMTAFRLSLRIDGQSLVREAVTPPNSLVTRSPFVRLAART